MDVQLTPIAGATPTYDDDGNERVVVATCGECGRSWNDAAISSVTPAPSARCPFEYEHDKTYIVIENTPGYLPEDDDPYIGDYAGAVAFLNDRAREYEEDEFGNYEVTYGCASSDNLAAVTIRDLDREHDLGRWIGIEEYRIDEQEGGL